MSRLSLGAAFLIKKNTALLSLVTRKKNKHEIKTFFDQEGIVKCRNDLVFQISVSFRAQRH